MLEVSISLKPLKTFFIGSFEFLKMSIQSYRQELAAQRASGGTNAIARNQLKEKAKAIREMLQADKELSSVARACVLSSGDSRITGLLQSA
jgi:hypothetical protein